MSYFVCSLCHASKAALPSEGRGTTGRPGGRPLHSTAEDPTKFVGTAVLGGPHAGGIGRGITGGFRTPTGTNAAIDNVGEGLAPPVNMDRCPAARLGSRALRRSRAGLEPAPAKTQGTKKAGVRQCHSCLFVVSSSCFTESYHFCCSLTRQKNNHDVSVTQGQMRRKCPSPHANRPLSAPVCPCLPLCPVPVCSFFYEQVCVLLLQPFGLFTALSV